MEAAKVRGVQRTAQEWGETVFLVLRHPKDNLADAKRLGELSADDIWRVKSTVSPSGKIHLLSQEDRTSLGKIVTALIRKGAARQTA